MNKINKNLKKINTDNRKYHSFSLWCTLNENKSMKVKFDLLECFYLKF